MRARQISTGKLGWWTVESLGINSEGLIAYLEIERAVYLTSIITLALSQYRSGRPVLEVGELKKSFVSEPDDIKVEILEK